MPDCRHDRESLLLASYAMHSADTAGRVHAEPPHPYRGPFARDRDRVLHSSAFRRLSGKMQVFTGEMGVYHRTRLTHTFEVASVARTMARTLRLNEDLTEALALMHDIGHPPYGHCGEDVLAERMQGVGGFSHNGFALVIVTELEQRYSAFPGLNLSRETLAGQDNRAHKIQGLPALAESGEPPRADDAAPTAAAIDVDPTPLLEVQIVDAADSIAYDAHDVDDSLQMGLLSIDELAELDIVRRSLDLVRQKHGKLPTSQLRQSLVHELIDLQVSDLLRASMDQLSSFQGAGAGEVCRSGLRLTHRQEISDERSQLESFLFDSVYRHPRLIPVRDAAAARLRVLFDTLIDDPNRLPLRFRQRAERVRIERVVGEYLAGMTDAFCDDQFQSLSAGGGPLSDW